MNSVSIAHGGVLTPAEEKRAAKSLSPAVAWPTLAMAAVLPLGQWAVVGLGATGVAPLWACAPIITLTAYAHYTLVHEAIHGNLAPGHPKLRWLNTLVGWIGALGLGYNWPVLLRGHSLHHAHTNTDLDPDIEVKGTLGHLVAKWLVFVPLSAVPPPLLRFIVPAQYQKLEQMLGKGEMLQATVVATGFLGVMSCFIATGHVLQPLCLLFGPTRVAALMLRIFFSWLPHHPFDRTERYLNTRISLWPGASLLLLQQNLHLMHHLWPSVPFYNYGRLYRRLRPVLIDKGSPIQGLMVGRYAKDRSFT